MRHEQAAAAILQAASLQQPGLSCPLNRDVHLSHSTLSSYCSGKLSTCMKVYFMGRHIPGRESSLLKTSSVSSLWQPHAALKPAPCKLFDPTNHIISFYRPPPCFFWVNQKEENTILKLSRLFLNSCTASNTAQESD